MTLTHLGKKYTDSEQCVDSLPRLGSFKGQSSLILLAPPDARVPFDFRSVHSNPERHNELLAKMQRLRGNVYLQDGAIESSQLSPDGRLRISIDESSWHLLAVDDQGKVCGCVRYTSHLNTAPFQELWVRNSALATSPRWSRTFRAAVEAEMREALLRNLPYVEVGGWALSPERRCSSEALRTVLATYSLARLLGGCIGITTATVRHNSSSILRRMGGSSLCCDTGEIPPYYDPQYRCEMEVLRFDSARLSPRFAPLLGQLSTELLNVPVVCRSRRRNLWPQWFGAQNITPQWMPAVQTSAY